MFVWNFLFGVSYYVNFQHLEWSMDNNMVNKIWVEMFTTIHLLQFKAICKNTRL